MPFQRLRGFKDVLDGEARKFERVEAATRAVFSRFGFGEIRIPILEEKALFARALGDETDVVQKEMYEFTDRSKVDVALRPEGTAGVVRAYLENNLDKTQGLAKLFYLGPMFRSERPQAGRLRQFHQVGVEELGTLSPYADAETIHCLTVFLDEAGARGWKLRLNNLGTFEERDLFKKELFEQLKPEADSLCEDCRLRLSKNVFRILDCKNESCRKIVEKTRPIGQYLTAESKDHYQKVCDGLKAAGIPYTEDPYMVRGLDYYTKTVFEVSHPKLGAQDALGAGGRYDRLIEAFGGKPAGAVGFAVGVERLLMCMEEASGGEMPENSIFIITLGEAAFAEGFKVLSRLRAQGVSAGMDFAGGSMKSQMRRADHSKSAFAVILGDDELKSGRWTLKNMRDGSQETVDAGECASFLKRKLASK